MSRDDTNTFQHSILFRRVGAIAVDLTIEFGGGLLGSYVGAMVAALVTALNHHDPIVMQDSIWRGLGFGFGFCSLSIAFVNRVLIQGLSRASIGKKVFGLELVTSTTPFTWQLMMKRWILTQVALVTGGFSYAVMFFNPEHRALHDIYMGTDVVPAFKATYAMEIEYQSQVQELYPQTFHQASSRMIVLTQDTAERPMATVIQLPVRDRTLIEAQTVEITGSPERVVSLAEVISITPAEKDEEDQAA